MQFSMFDINLGTEDVCTKLVCYVSMVLFKIDLFTYIGFEKGVNVHVSITVNHTNKSALLSGCNTMSLLLNNVVQIITTK